MSQNTANLTLERNFSGTLYAEIRSGLDQADEKNGPYIVVIIPSLQQMKKALKLSANDFAAADPKRALLDRIGLADRIVIKR